MGMDTSEMRLSDEVIGQVAKLVQLGILTGTNVVDNLRTLRVTVSEDENELVLTDSYRELADNQIKKLMEDVQSLEKV
jgi:hypothetical protein